MVDIGLAIPSVFIVTPSLGGLPTKAEESPLPMRQTCPRRTPTRYFMVSGRANRYYTLLKGDLEVIVEKGNLILPRRNSTTGCSLTPCPGQLLLLLLLCCVSAYALAVLIAVITPIRRVLTNDQGLTRGPSSKFTFLILCVVSLLFLTVQSFAYQRCCMECQAFQSIYQILWVHSQGLQLLLVLLAPF